MYTCSLWTTIICTYTDLPVHQPMRTPVNHNIKTTDSWNEYYWSSCSGVMLCWESLENGIHLTARWHKLCVQLTILHTKHAKYSWSKSDQAKWDHCHWGVQLPSWALLCLKQCLGEFWGGGSKGIQTNIRTQSLPQEQCPVATITVIHLICQ